MSRRRLPLLAAAAALAAPWPAAAQSCAQREGAVVCRVLSTRAARATVAASTRLASTAPDASARMTIVLDGRSCASSEAHPGLFGFHAAAHCLARLAAGPHVVEARVRPLRARVLAIAVRSDEGLALRDLPAEAAELSRIEAPTAARP